MASRLTTSAAHLTVSAEAQAVEDRLTTLGTAARTRPTRPPRFDDAAAAAFAEIDDSSRRSMIPYEEWEVLYRQRLQVERDLRAGAMAGEAVLGAETPGTDGPLATLTAVGRLLRDGAEAVLDLAADERTSAAAGNVAGPQVRIATKAAAVAITAVRGALRGADRRRGRRRRQRRCLGHERKGRAINARPFRRRSADRSSVPVDLVPVPDLQQEELPALDELLDRAGSGAGREAGGRVDLCVEEEGALPECGLAIDDAARLLVDRQERRAPARRGAEARFVEATPRHRGRRP